MFWLIIFFSSQCEIPKFSLVQNSNFNLFKIKLVFGVIFYDSQEIINFYVSLSVLAHCGFNQDVVTKCLTSESRHEARVRGSHPAQLSHLHMKLFQLALWELCLTKFLFNGVGTEKKSLPLCYRGQSALFRLSLHSICWDNDPPSPQSFFPFALFSSSRALHANLMHWRAVNHTEVAFGGQSHCLWALVAYLLASHYSNNDLLTDF